MRNNDNLQLQESYVQVMRETAEFSTNPEDDNYDVVHKLMEKLPIGCSKTVFDLINAVLSDRAGDAGGAIDHLLGLLEDKMEAEEEDAVGGFGGPDDSLGDVTADDPPYDVAGGSLPNDGRFPKGG